jgi:hypothetical protein
MERAHGLLQAPIADRHTFVLAKMVEPGLNDEVFDVASAIGGILEQTPCQRTGALAWGLFEDAADRGRYVEYFIVESWLDHLRQHERVTVSDRRLQEAVRAFHVGTEPPIVSHLVAPPARAV